MRRRPLISFAAAMTTHVVIGVLLSLSIKLGTSGNHAGLTMVFTPEEISWPDDVVTTELQVPAFAEAEASVAESVDPGNVELSLSSVTRSLEAGSTQGNVRGGRSVGVGLRVEAGSLGSAGEFRGCRICLWGPNWSFCSADSELVSHLSSLGFEVQVRHGPFQSQWANDVDQLWLCPPSDPEETLGVTATLKINRFVGEPDPDRHLLAHGEYFDSSYPNYTKRVRRTIDACFSRGKGIVLLSPGSRAKQANINYIAPPLFQCYEFFEPTRDSEHYQYFKVLPCSHRAVRASAAGRYEPMSIDSVRDPLLTGVHFLFEVHTWGIGTAKQEDVVLTGTVRQTNVLKMHDPRQRVVIDGDCSRFDAESLSLKNRVVGPFMDVTAGNRVFAGNIAAYLQGKEYPWSDHRDWPERHKLLCDYYNYPNELLTHFLAYGKEHQRWTAARLLRQRKSQCINELIDALADASSDVAIESRRALCALASNADFGPAWNADLAACQKSQAAWRHWFEIHERTATVRESLEQAPAAVLKEQLVGSDSESRWAAALVTRERKLDLLEELRPLAEDPSADVATEAEISIREIEGYQTTYVDLPKSTIRKIEQKIYDWDRKHAAKN